MRSGRLPLKDIGNVVAEVFESGPDAARFGSTPRRSTVLGKRVSGGDDTLQVELAQTDQFSVQTYRTYELEEETVRDQESLMSEMKRNVRPLSSLEGREDAGQWARCGRGEEAEGEDTVRMEGEDEYGARLDETVHPPSPPFFRSDTAETAHREWASQPTPQVVSALDSPQFATPVSSRRGSKKENEGEMEDTL
ncbi:hypothetical protein BLNAU_19099 [Blattamonas nauphoetae]|uniref:Uncharacterized protein n=1 Tax=Blattamonas nauphoetae TaxID=2049346 RepID=A0ABQ9X6K6_9EUKA|nr:hypothetical protein BLNAU_19099 [Blattamonas nauphoetae]